MKIAFHYFSGCGNSAWVVIQAQKKLQSLGHEVVLIQNMETALPAQMPASDVDFFVAPTYFLGLPANFIGYLKRLPMVASRKAIFWSVNGGMVGASKFIAENLLKDRGYEVIVVADAVSSRKSADCACALQMMRDQGIHLLNSESVLFMMLRDAAHPAFKAISKLIK